MTRALAISIHSAADGRSVHGVYQRLDMIMRALCGVADEVDFLSLNSPYATETPQDRAAWQSSLRQRWSSNVALVDSARGLGASSGRLYWPRYLRGLVDYRAVEPVSKVDVTASARAIAAALARKPDVIFAHRLGSIAPLLRAARTAPLPPVVFDMDDIEHVAQARRLLGRMSPMRDRMRVAHTPALLVLERRALSLARATLVCSEHDRRVLHRLRSSAPVQVVPNGVDLVAGVPSQDGPPTVLFVGSFDYRPNAIAAQELAAEIWPLIRAAVPDARLRIVGNRPERVPASQVPAAGVEFTGFVTDLAREYAQAHVVCCPIRSGGGTRIKIIEAAAYSRPVVSTALGAEGLHFAPGTEICIVDPVEGLARACVDLLQNPGRAQLIAQAAHERVAREYDRRAVSGQLQALFRSVVPA